MAVRFARDMPEARSRLLRYLRSFAAEDWAPLPLGSEQFPVPPHLRTDSREPLARRVVRWSLSVLGSSDLCYVSDDLTDLALRASRTLPEFRMHPEVLPVEHGLLGWAHDLTDRPAMGGGGRSRITAASWTPITGGVWVTFYDDAPAFFSALRADEQEAALARYGRLIEGPGLLLPWTQRAALAPSWAHRPQLRAALLTLVATWLLMGQTITEAAAVHPARSDARRIARRGDPTDPVRYVALRRVQHPDPAGQQPGRDYRHQWIVAGHWRNQWYPSVGEHRPVWIHPHVKGPPGKPMLHAERVYTLRR
jgi:hypothetical protein